MKKYDSMMSVQKQFSGEDGDLARRVFQKEKNKGDG
jgi:hypothetical protein